MSRLPIRLRVALAFATALAVVLAATGAFVYLRLDADLRAALDRELRQRADDLRALVEAPGGTLAGPSALLVERGESVAQLLDPGGSVLDASPTLGDEPVLTTAELSRAAAGPILLDRGLLPGLDGPARLLALPVERDDQPLVLVVGASREDRDEALAGLLTELLIAGPVALVVATGAGYLLAGAGLGAVEAMRRRAAAISAAHPGERLPVPATRDELERLGHTLNEMLARLEQALERERAFVAEAGHELRTPLALVRAELDFALHQARDGAELREAVRRASDETDRLVQLAGDLLLTASADRGALALRVERLGAAELLESVRNRFLWRAADGGQELAVVAPPGLAVRGDRLRLEQALGNLVDNALRHGGGQVTLSAQRGEGVVLLAVEDGGPGFPADFLPRAFERFSRPDEGRSGGGAGLGLAIVSAIAAAHGGSARAEGRPGGGAVVVLELPG